MTTRQGSSLWIVLGVFLTLSVALAVFLWFESDEATPRLGTMIRTTEEESPVVRRESLSDVSTVPVDVTKSVDAKDEAEGVVLVRCVEAGTEKPVSGLTVYLWRISDLPPPAKRAKVTTEAEMHRVGQGHVVDSQGRLPLQVPSEPFGIGAFSDSLYGSLEFRETPKDREIVLSLAPRRFVAVKVVDFAGNPVQNAWVELVCWRGDSWSTLHREMVSSESGTSSIPLQALDQLAPEAKEAFLRLGGLFEPHVEVAFDAVHLPKEALVLVSPGSGAVEVRVITNEGEEPEPGCLWLTVEDVAPRGSGIVRRVLQTQSELVSKDLVSIAPLALKRRYVLKLATQPESRYLDQEIEFDGPVENAEIVPITLDLRNTARRLFVIGRLLDEEGRPMVKSLTLLYSASGGKNGSSSMAGLKTDHEGRFSVPLGAAATDWDEVKFKIFGVNADQEPISAEGLSQCQPGLGFDMGDMSIALQPRVAAGRVIDETGAAVVGASVTLKGHSRGIYYSGPGGEGTATTDAEGRFQLYDREAGSTFTLWANADGYSDEEQEVNRGAEQLLFRLSRESAFKARLLVNDESILARLSPVLCYLDPNSRRDVVLYPESDGTMSYSGQTGRADFEVRLRQTNEVLWESKALELRAGDSLDLGEIPIRIDGRQVTLKFIYPKLGTVNLEGRNDRFSSEGTVELVAEDGSIQELLSRLDSMQTQAKLYLPTDAKRLRVRMPGFRSEIVRVDRDDLVVRLRAGIPIVLKFSGLSGVPEEDVRVTLFLRLQEENSQVELLSRHRLEDASRFEGLLEGSGRLRLGLQVSFKDVEGNWTALKLDDHMDVRTFEVVDQETPQEFQVTVKMPRR